MREMEVVVASIQRIRNTDLGVFVHPIQSLPHVACSSHDPWLHPLSHLTSSQETGSIYRHLGVRGPQSLGLVRLPEGHSAGDRKADRATAPW
jgi:hypothetical protein